MIGDGETRRLRRRPMTRHIEREHYTPYYLTVIANAISSSASQVYLREFGIGVNDWRVLSHLGLEPGCTAQVISNVLQVDKSVVSRSVRTLVDRGLVGVEATPGFRRLYLTAAGAELHKRMVPVALQRERLLLTGLDDAEVELLLGLLRRVHANLPALTAYDPGRTPSPRDPADPPLADTPLAGSAAEHPRPDQEWTA
ncbi:MULTISPECIES: MarR family winged helix-turn-helix transcriptional regulator [unclassified Geodermatophilus]|uniref:MarR family winged helix-turn-helix transcriptional regulator n=1 Tax=unclassified Geodermatophilus TaxID=2637632 RepID=UPI003EEFFE2F